MTGFSEMRRLERAMTYVRWFGVAFGVVALLVQDEWPSADVQWSAWGAVVALALGNVAIWGTLARADNARHLSLLFRGAFAFDTAVVCSFVWIFAYEDPYQTWALLFLLPMEGALRYRLKGALGAAGVVALFFIPQTFRVAHIHGEPFEATTYVFVVGLTALTAGVVGSMAENWREKSDALEEQTLKLAEIDRLKDRFLAVTSHEIRGPLTAIIAGVDTVQKRGDKLTDEQRDRLLEMVGLQGHQLARMVDDLMVTAQVQGGKPALRLEWADLHSTIEQATEAAELRRRQHQLEVFVDPLECKIDAARVTQIVRNLVENAYKYTAERTRVGVTARRDGSELLIEVDDDGFGIPRDKRDRLFEAFSRIEETAAGQDGVGLGLYVVSQLTAAMDGRIDLQSSSQGTTFTIRIPCEIRSQERPRLGVVEDDGQQDAG